MPKEFFSKMMTLTTLCKMKSNFFEIYII